MKELAIVSWVLMILMALQCARTPSVKTLQEQHVVVPDILKDGVTLVNTVLKSTLQITTFSAPVVLDSS
jgi:hypothetical protein